MNFGYLQSYDKNVMILTLVAMDPDGVKHNEILKDLITNTILFRFQILLALTDTATGTELTGLQADTQSGNAVVASHRMFYRYKNTQLLYEVLCKNLASP